MRLIDADALIKSTDKESIHMYQIALAPTVDPIKHGHWTPNPHNREWDVCSSCRIGTKRREYGINPDGNEYMTEYSYRYCPNCGAKMDERET